MRTIGPENGCTIRERRRETMKPAGYSGTPLPRKLGIKAGQKIWYSGAPDGYAREISKVGRLEVARTLRKGQDFIHFFAGRRAALNREIPRLRDSMKPDAILWISWPKKSSGVVTDLDENVVREVGLAAGLVDVKVCAVDDVWAGLKFVVRLRDR
jgi:hypothetical protein